MTAVGFVILVVIGSVLWVFVWDKIDNKRKKSGIDLGDDTSDEVAPLPLVNQLQRCHKAHPAVGVRISHRNGLSHGSNDGSRI